MFLATVQIKHISLLEISMLKRILLFFQFFGLINVSICQDIVGGYIYSKKITGINTYSINVILYSDASIINNRNSIKLDFGDATTATFTLASVNTSNNLKSSIYSGSHTYPGMGLYNILYKDSFRIASIKNMTNSNLQKIYLQHLINVDLFFSNNNSPKLNQLPVSANYSVVGNSILYNPQLTDIEGDSVSYSVYAPSPPNSYLPNTTTINPTTGLFSAHKDSLGKYCNGIVVKEWRKNGSDIYVTISQTQCEFVHDVALINDLKNNALLNFKVYPNPTHDKLRFTKSDNYNLETEVRITNIFGELVFHDFFSSMVFEIDVQHFPCGLYITTINSGNKNKIFKVIKE